MKHAFCYMRRGVAAVLAAAFVLAAGWAATAQTDLPARYYLTNIGLVTPAKQQSPWGVCWAFAGVAAVESAVLKATHPTAGLTADGRVNTGLFRTPKLTGLNDSIDLSERAAAWFALRQHGLDDQQGEGIGIVYPYTAFDDYDYQFTGGDHAMLEALFSAGQGLLREDQVPYAYNGYTPGKPPAPESQAAVTKSWAVDRSWLTADQQAVVEEMIYLPSPSRVRLQNDAYVWRGYDADATRAMKQAMLTYGGLAVGIEGDVSVPGALQDVSYMNVDRWAQYNDADTPAMNHAVTLVGWNDDLPREWFAAKDNALPPGDGGWLAKNSWGSAANGSGGYGVDGTGFFWISYYDHSLTDPVCFKARPVETAPRHIYQYDYLGKIGPDALRTGDTDAMVANWFVASREERLTAVSARTLFADTTVDIAVYLLPAEALADGDPTNDRPPVLRQTQQFPYAGYYEIPLQAPVHVPAGAVFCLVQHQVAPNPANPAQLVATLPLEVGDDVQYYIKNRQVRVDSTGRYRAAKRNQDAFLLCLASPDVSGTLLYYNHSGGGCRWCTPDQVQEEWAVGVNKACVLGNALIKAFATDDLTTLTGVAYMAYTTLDQPYLAAVDPPVQVLTDTGGRMVTGVTLDDVPLPPDAYTLADDGSVTLAPDVWQNCADGDHTVALQFADGAALCTVPVEQFTMPGDVDRNGVINAVDALLVLQIGVKRFAPNRAQRLAGDVTGNGAIDAVDALNILRRAVGKAVG